MASPPGGELTALPGWSPGAFKIGARERWLGWPPRRQFRRLHLIASNTRFLVLPAFQVPNLASRALGLSAKCLSSDMEALDEPESWGLGDAEPPKADRLRSLYDFLRKTPEFRKPCGVRH